MMKPRIYVWAYLRGLGLLTLALFFPLIVIITVANGFVGVNVGREAWRAIWSGVAAAELTFVVLAAVQWKRAWALSRNHPSRRRIAGGLVVLAAVLLVGAVVFIAANIRSTCAC